MSRMSEKRHREIAAHAGDFLLKPLPKAGFADELEDVVASAGVYVVCTRTDEVLYTGSARRLRDPHGLVKRMKEHLKDENRRMRWLRVWLIPMTLAASLRQVRLAEGMVGRDLGCRVNQRLPRILPPDPARTRAS